MVENEASSEKHEQVSIDVPELFELSAEDADMIIEQPSMINYAPNSNDNLSNLLDKRPNPYEDEEEQTKKIAKSNGGQSISKFSITHSKISLTNAGNNCSVIKHVDDQLIDNKYKLFLEKFIENYEIKNEIENVSYVLLNNDNGCFLTCNKLYKIGFENKSKMQHYLAEKTKFCSDSQNGYVKYDNNNLFNFSLKYVDSFFDETFYFYMVS